MGDIFVTPAQQLGHHVNHNLVAYATLAVSQRFAATKICQ